MTILDRSIVHKLAKDKANMEYTKIQIYRRANGEYLIAAIGNLALVKQYLPEGEQLEYVGFEIPDQLESSNADV